MASIPREKDSVILQEYNDQLAQFEPPYDPEEEMKVLRRRYLNYKYGIDVLDESELLTVFRRRIGASISRLFTGRQ